MLELDEITDAAGRENLAQIGPGTRLRNLAQRQGGEYAGLRNGYGYFAYSLLNEAFHNGKPYIIPDIPNLLREVDDYIRRVGQLAERAAAWQGNPVAAFLHDSPEAQL